METALISGVIGGVTAIIAIWGVVTQRQIARRRATLDHMSRSESDVALIAAKKKFHELARYSGGLAQWADEDKVKSEEAQKVLFVLDHCELISIGIQRGILDYKIYRMCSRSAIIRVWDDAHPFITTLRNRVQNQVLFHEFEKMANWLKTKMPYRILWRGLFF